MSTIYANYTASRLTGVGGWLLFLCIVLTFVSPLTLISGGTAEMATGLSGVDRNPSFAYALIGDGLFRIGLAAFSFIAGLALWRQSANAVQTAKRFLLLYLVFTVVRMLLPYCVTLQPESREQIASAFFKTLLATVVFTLTWHQYLSRSWRVRNTYSS